MRPIEYYANEVLAQGKPVIAIVTSMESDDLSAWWEVGAYFAMSQAAPDWVEERAHGHEFEHYLVELPPGEIDSAARKRGDGINIKDPTPKREQDLDGTERELAVGLGRALASSLGVPFFVEPIEGRFQLNWWSQAQTRKLVEILRRSRHALVVTGRHGAWHEPEYGATQSQHCDALATLFSRDLVKGIISEGSCDCLDSLGIPEACMAKSGGHASAAPTARIEALLEHADLILAVGSPLEQEPLCSQVMAHVRARGVPLVCVRYDCYTDDPRANMVIFGPPETVLTLLVRLI